MAAYHVLKIDSLIESLTLCNSASGFTFSLDASSEIIAQPGDLILGNVSEPTNEVRYLFEVVSSDGNELVLKKKLESSEGVAYDFSSLPELQPNVYEKTFFTISEKVFLSILSRLSRVYLPSSTSGTAAAPGAGKTIQKILYGCPGTGKSRIIKDGVEGENGEYIVYFDDKGDKIGDVDAFPDKSKITCNIFRTTFHPDYDYSTFVGSYKPVMIPEVDATGKETGKEELAYEFVPQVFTNAYVRAWKSLADASLIKEEKQVYLIIEEINRGNCAQIFGDLFQLLDRKDGRSEFSIIPDAELRKYLKKEGLESNKLVLPENLNIYATMNTSDQSLFPMDSAFKRRWAMEYVPINLDQKIAKEYTFKISDEEYSWVEFLRKINPLIRKATDSEDKQMGEFFIKGHVTEEEFVNKVMFYIWNDVCKDLYSASRISPLYFMRSASGEDKKDVFTFAELFGDGRHNEDDGTDTKPKELMVDFITKYLEMKPLEKKKSE